MDSGNAFGLVETHLPLDVMLIRLGIAALFGGMIGFERGRRTAEVGLRTHILIAVAACLFTVLAFEIYHTLEGAENRADPIRAVEAVTAGIAFLGAGAIFRSGGNVQGLTTGAGMWLAGAVGIACALGYYVTGLVVSLFAIVVLALLRHFSHHFVSGEDDD